MIWILENYDHQKNLEFDDEFVVNNSCTFRGRATPICLDSRNYRYEEFFDVYGEQGRTGT